MKKIITVLAVLCITLTLVGCDNKKIIGTKYTLGMGAVTSLEESTNGTAEVDCTVASVVLDSDGKIVLCSIDSAQNKVKIESGMIEDASFKTKMEQGDDYNLKENGSSTYEWYEQVHNFEAYCVGKTVSEIEKIETKVRDDKYAGYVVAKDETLFASCSIQITDFIAAVVKACKDDQAVSFDADGDSFELGVAIYSWIESNSKEADAENEGVVNVYSDYAAAVVDKDSKKVVAALNDGIQPKIGFDVDGYITAKTYSGTKRELKENYNMKKYAGCTYEWYEQSATFSAYCAGKTAEEIENLSTKVRDDKYAGYVVTTDDKLFASCSIQITGMMRVIAQAAKYAITPAN